LVFVGSVLLALLFVLNWSLPSPSVLPIYGAPIDGTTLHIRSEQKWPQRLQFDTAVPAMLPPSPSVVAAKAIEDPKLAEDPKLNALAEARPPEAQATVKSKSHVAMRHRHRKSPGLRFAVGPTPPTWPPSW
jgi:hypothetical protein